MTWPLERTVLWLTWRQLFARRRLYAAIAFALLPVLFTFVFRFNAEGRDGDLMRFFSALNRNLIVGTLIPLAAAVFGTTAFGGEVDDGTLVYLLVKPIARWRIVLSKYLVAVLSTLAVGVPALVLPWLVLRNDEVTGGMLQGFLVGAVLASVIYCAIFLALGVATRRALVFALLYIIAFEGVLSRQLEGVKAFSVREWSVSVSLAASEGALKVAEYTVPMNTVYTMGSIFLAVALTLSLRRLSRYEVAERL
jgi:ABC-2 type transport system permease protein